MKYLLTGGTLVAVVLVLTVTGNMNSHAQQTVITGDARVDHLLSQMTLEEKISMIHEIGRASCRERV